MLSPCIRIISTVVSLYFSTAKPSKLHNCSFELLENSTISWLKIECVSGYDGGLQQTFHLEIYQTNSLLMNVSNDVPIFYIDITTLNVVETTLLHLLLYSTNPKGKSETVVLKGIAFENAEKRTGAFFRLILYKLISFES